LDDGAEAPYSVNVSSDTLNKTTGGTPNQELVYSRAASVIDPESGAYLTVRLGSVFLKLRGGERLEIPLLAPPADSLTITPETVFDLAGTAAFVIPSEADSLEFRVAVYGKALEALKPGVSAQCGLTLDFAEGEGGASISALATKALGEASLASSAMSRCAIAVSSLAKKAGSSAVVLRPSVSGLTLTPKLIASLGHIYAPAKEAPLAKSAPGADAESKNPSKPALYALGAAYPNPFNPSTQMQLHLGEPGFVSLAIYDVLGQKVATLIEGSRSAGDYTVRWNPARAASGMYFARLVVCDDLRQIKYSNVNKLMLSK
jgi:hypothetical protein